MKVKHEKHRLSSFFKQKFFCVSKSYQFEQAELGRSRTFDIILLLQQNKIS